MISLFKKFFQSDDVYLLILPGYILVVLIGTIFYDKGRTKELKEKGIKVMATVKEAYVGPSSQAVFFSCSFNYNGPKIANSTEHPAWDDPDAKKGKTYPAIYLERDSSVQLIIDKRDSIRYGLLVQ